MISLIANTGIHTFTFPLDIISSDKFERIFREWYDEEQSCFKINLLHKIINNDEELFYNKKDLYDKGYLAADQAEILESDLRGDNILPLSDEELEGKFKMSFYESMNSLSEFFENVWLPMPYFYQPNPDGLRFKFGSFNWVRFMIVPKADNKNADTKSYNVILAIDTRAKYTTDKYQEMPTFPDSFKEKMLYAPCSDEILLLDYCSRDDKRCSYIDKYILSLVHPNVQSVAELRGKGHKMSYIASYFLLVAYIAERHLFPSICLYRDQKVEEKQVDMIVDIGNSRTTAVLKEGNNNCAFDSATLLTLQDFTSPITDSSKPSINYHKDPFDMRLAFHKVEYGNLTIEGSRQFIYPSLVRLGEEANYLIHQVDSECGYNTVLSTCSSPKRYLWDSRPSKYEWHFLSLDGTPREQNVLRIEGVTNQLNSDGSFNNECKGGGTHHYSRQSLMTFAFLEMLSQAYRQVNSPDYREFRGEARMPRRLKRLIITCPTTMSEVERKALSKCAENAARIFQNFFGLAHTIEVVPSYIGHDGEDNVWYYDEATCSQLVYVFSEIGHKYKGNSSEFFKLYGNSVQNKLKKSQGFQ